MIKLAHLKQVLNELFDQFKKGEIVLNLGDLAPRIVEGILDGTGPAKNIKVRDVLKDELPSLWAEQEENWGFGR